MMTLVVLEALVNSVIIDLYMIQSYDQSRVARGRVRPERAELCPFHEARGCSINPCLSHYRDGFLPILGDYVSRRRLWAEAGNAASPISTSSGTIPNSDQKKQRRNSDFRCRPGHAFHCHNQGSHPKE